MSESAFQAAIIEVAKLKGYLIYHTYDSRRSNPGFPDLVLVHPDYGPIRFFECKSATGRITGEQEQWLRATLERTTTSAMVRPDDLDWIIKSL